jgi:branched-chain amino acid transport system permease protein
MPPDTALILGVILSGLLMGGVYALVSGGLSFIWGVLKVVNMAHGSFLMLSMYVVYWTWRFTGLDPLLTIPITMGLLFLLGICVQKGIIRHILEASLVNQIFVTFGMWMFMNNVALMLWKENFRTIRDPLIAGGFGIIGVRISLPKLVSFGFSVLATFALWIFLQKTKIGIAIRAVAQDRKAAWLMGIDVDRIYEISFGLGLATVGLAGSLLASFFSVYPYVGDIFHIFALTIVTLGGFGSISGSFIAGLIIGLAEAVSAFVNPALKYLVVFAIFLIILLFKPEGLREAL